MAEAFANHLAGIRSKISQPANDDNRRKSVSEPWKKPDWIDKNDPVYIIGNQNGGLPGSSDNPVEFKFPVLQTDLNEANPIQANGNLDGKLSFAAVPLKKVTKQLSQSEKRLNQITTDSLL